ncbi:MAG TPA: hypothetical protein VHL58_15585 [Thermoanaerobaculia bacterium]|nr:hypothetical protein [Thermoanaerobaculia bacterium]
MGQDNQVRLTARLATDRFAPNSLVGIRFDVENRRDEPIAVADIASETVYDVDSGVITVNVGSEVPGNEFLPRLVKVGAGETKIFRTSARVRASVIAEGTQVSRPRSIRVNLHFLTAIEPFAKLIDISEKAIRDPALADSLFALWVDHIQAVATNDLPIRWGGPNTVNFGGPSEH